MNTKRNILPMLLAALLLFCLPMASLAEDVPHSERQHPQYAYQGADSAGKDRADADDG